MIFDLRSSIVLAFSIAAYLVWSFICSCFILKENADQEVNVSEKTGICTQIILEQTWQKLIEN